MTLPPEAIIAMHGAKNDQDGWYVYRDEAKILKPYGLCEAGTTRDRHYLGVFATAVLMKLKTWNKETV